MSNTNQAPAWAIQLMQQMDDIVRQAAEAQADYEAAQARLNGLSEQVEQVREPQLGDYSPDGKSQAEIDLMEQFNADPTAEIRAGLRQTIQQYREQQANAEPDELSPQAKAIVNKAKQRIRQDADPFNPANNPFNSAANEGWLDRDEE